MGIADAASGQSDNAGKAGRGIDDAISAALDASETASLSDALKAEDLEPESVEADAQDEIGAGDEPSLEDAAEADASKQDDGPVTLVAPKHWPEADKQAFGKLTREGQEIALKLAKNLEGGFTRKSQELSDKARFADSVRGLFDDTTRAQLQTANLDEVGYVRYLHEVQQFATQKPVEYVKWAMQKLGVTAEQLGISQAKPDPKTEAAQGDDLERLLSDPKVAQLEAEVKSLRDYINQDQSAKQQATVARRNQELTTINSHIKAFRESLDDSGQLQFPHFDSVRAHMGALMDADLELSKMPDGVDKLKAAYDMAVFARPDLRQSLIEAEAQKKAAEELKKREASRAKKVTSVKPSAGVVSTKVKAASLDDAINQATSKLGF